MQHERLRVNTPQVIHESIDGEVIIIDLGTGTYYSLKGSGADVWELIHGQPGVDSSELVDLLAPGYTASRDEIVAAIASFLADLRSEGLVIEATAGTQVASTTTSRNGLPKAAFEAPTLEKYTDMQDLVLIDPVHQVDETGWPQVRPEAAPQSASA